MQDETKQLSPDEQREQSARDLYRKSDQQRQDEERRAQRRPGDARTKAQQLYNRSNMSP